MKHISAISLTKAGLHSLVPAAVQPLLPASLELTPRQIRLIETRTTIQQTPGTKEDATFMANYLVQVTLPHSDPGDVPVWTKTNGEITLVVARINVDERTGHLIGYPYGSIPRLLLYWMTSEAVRTKSRVLRLGSSLNEFMEAVGLSSKTGGGKRSNYVRLRDQMNRLFAASIAFQRARSNDGPQQRLNMNVATRSELWWDPKKPGDEGLFQSFVELGEEFFKRITDKPVPVDVRALKALNHSPLALDLYGWSTYKAFSTSKRRSEEFVSYRDLQAQLGTQYSDVKDFKKRFKVALRCVETVYPGLDVLIDRGGIIVRPSRTAIPAAG